MLYDTHAHLNDKAFLEDAEEALQRALDAGVTRINVVGCDPEMSAKAVELAEKHEAIYAAVGIHPSDADKYDDAFEEQLRRWAALDKVVAIGEIGLDYHYEDDIAHDIQQDVFRRQLRLAKELMLPVVIHSRDAMEDTVRILREEQPEDGFRGVFHCFSGSWEQAQVVLDMGFYIGFDGPLTFKNSKKLPRVAMEMPADRILIETDCPYMAPEPKRGRRNEPALVGYVSAKVAELRGISEEEAAQLTYENGCRLFGIK
ncbi:MAG: TatD family hydrolase [Firmicutes bacterium]|nr:TatD family hydrolase [Bacillota bacterium]